MTETQITQADRDAYAAALEKMKYARSADAVRNGFEDKHPIVQAFAAHRANSTDATPVAWMPIESAPKDGTVVDLWVRPYTGTAYRACNYWWLESAKVWRTDIRKHDIPNTDTPTHWRQPPLSPSTEIPPTNHAQIVVSAILDKLHNELPYPTEACALVRIAARDYAHPPATDVAALAESLQTILEDTHPEAYPNERQVLAPFTKGQNDDAVR